MNRRRFINTSAIAGAGIGLGFAASSVRAQTSTGKPAILGGSKTNTDSIPSWPVYDGTEDASILEAVHSGKWGRLIGAKVAGFEKAFSQLTKAKHCVATSSGTTALITSMGALGIGPGDEVIIPPYTFIATYNAVVTHYALPRFVDVDPETFQIDAKKIGSAINENTKAIVPVHIGGTAPDMDAVMAASKKVPVIEDACQAHLAEWRGQSVGLSGLAGCFSFQASKNLPAGEGGMIVTNDDDFAVRCYNFHNHGRGSNMGTQPFTGERGANFRMTEFQGAILLAQLKRLAQQSKTRDENTAYLRKLLSEIPGIKPARLLEGNTRSSHHLFMMRYDKEQFAGLSRDKFLQAMGKEGFSCASGYKPLPTDDYVKALAKNPHYQKVYGKQVMSEWVERNHCPVNEKLCAEAVWFTQPTLLGTRKQMEQIAEAMRKIQAHAGEIARA